MAQLGQHLYDVMNKNDTDLKEEFITLLKVRIEFSFNTCICIVIHIECKLFSVELVG